METKGIGSWSFGPDHGCRHVSFVADYATPGCMVSERRDDGIDWVVLSHGYISTHSVLRYRFCDTTRPVVVPKSLRRCGLL